MSELGIYLGLYSTAELSGAAFVNNLLLEDDVSNFLLEDNVSYLLLEA